MNSRLRIASPCRLIARIGSVLVLLFGIPFLLFIGLQIISGEAANPTIYLYMLVLAGIFTGLVVAWRNEALGATITLISMAGSFALSGALLPGGSPGKDFALFAGPIHLLFALLIPGYHPEVSPSARLVPVISWILQVVPVLLFFASWWLRKAPKSKTLEEVSTIEEEK